MVETLIISSIGIVSAAFLVRRIMRSFRTDANAKNASSGIYPTNKRTSCDGSCADCHRSKA